MSHFSVLVCLPKTTDLANLETVLDDVMAPWDENTRVEPYPRYEDGAAEDHSFVWAARKAVEDLRNGTGLKAYDPTYLGWSTDRTNETPEQQRAGFAEGAMWAERLGEHPTWELVVKLSNEKYYPATQLAVPGEEDDEPDDRLHYEPETDRAYTLSTYNPESKWDYWRIGGRWGDYFPAKEAGPGLIRGGRGWDSPKKDPFTRMQHPHCDGGPIRLLAFDVMRDEEERLKGQRYDLWEKVSADTPPAKAWSHFYGLVELKEIDMDAARKLYGDQPRIASAKQHDEFRWACPVEEFLPDREEYIAAARRGAVAGYALVTLDREWVAPGRMGWFGMSSDGPGERDGYHHAVNRYLDQLDQDTFLIALDCHI